MLNLLKILRRSIKSLAHRFFPYLFVSTGYSRVGDSEVESESRRLSGAWGSHLIPAKQRRIVNRELIKYRSGKLNVNFDSIVDAIKMSVSSTNSKTSILEIGCSSGYYYEVFAIAGLNIEYTGVDYSPYLIEMARKYYPNSRFEVNDAQHLKFSDSSFELVISGCCLLHIPDYEKAIAESVRVASRRVIFHRTPVIWGEDTKYYRKYAYGVETIEIHFNEKYFLGLLKKYGLKVVNSYTLSQFGAVHLGGAIKTYLCEKVSP